jgi:hypothetical protein
MENIHIIGAIVTIVIIILYVNDINNKAKLLDDREHLSEDKKLFSKTQIAVIVGIVFIVPATIIGVLFFFANKSSVKPIEQ